MREIQEEVVGQFGQVKMRDVNTNGQRESPTSTPRANTHSQLSSHYSALPSSAPASAASAFTPLPVLSMQALTSPARRQSASKHVLKRSARFLCLHRCPPCSVRTTIKKLLRFSVSFRARFLYKPLRNHCCQGSSPFLVLLHFSRLL